MGFFVLVIVSEGDCSSQPYLCCLFLLEAVFFSLCINSGEAAHLQELPLWIPSWHMEFGSSYDSDTKFYGLGDLGWLLFGL
jgi:hypothetical protein